MADTPTGTGTGPVFRVESGYPPYNYYYNNNNYYTDIIEKRQLFLRSYQFSRKKSHLQRIKRSFFRVKRVIWVKLRSVRRFRKMLWLRIKHYSLLSKRNFLRLNNNKKISTSCVTSSCSPSLFW